jgi:hypothetical protein
LAAVREEGTVAEQGGPRKLDRLLRESLPLERPVGRR